MAVLQPGTTGTFSVGRSIGYGWRKSWKNFWRLLLISIVFMVINGAVSLISGFGSADPIELTGDVAKGPESLRLAAEPLWDASGLAIAIVGAVLSILVAFFLNLGMIRVALGVTEGQPAQIGRIFHFKGFGRYLGGGIVVGVIVTIGVVVGVVPGFLLANSLNSILWAIAGIAVGIIIGVVLGLAFSFYGYVIVNGDARGLSGLGGSWALVRQRFWGLVGLHIVLALLSIAIIMVAVVAGLLMLIVGLLITIPIATVVVFGLSSFSIAYAYKTISGEAVAP